MNSKSFLIDFICSQMISFLENRTFDSLDFTKMTMTLDIDKATLMDSPVIYKYTIPKLAVQQMTRFIDK